MNHNHLNEVDLAALMSIRRYSEELNQPAAPLPGVTIYTKGSCAPNPGMGTYGVVLQFGHHTKSLSGFLPSATNNLMEITAAVEALKALKTPCSATVYSNSEWFIKCVTGVSYHSSHSEQWELLARLSSPHDITWQWTKEKNRQAIALAQIARQNASQMRG